MSVVPYVACVESSWSPGRLVRSYPSDNGRRLRQGILCLIATVVLVPLGVLSWFLDDDLKSSTPAAPSMTIFTWIGSVCVGLSVLCLPYGARRLVQGMRHRGERIDLYADGFVHHRDATSDVEFRWQDVTTVDARGVWQPGKLGNRLGIDYRCVVSRSDGRKVVINAFYPDALELADAIGTAVGRRT